MRLMYPARVMSGLVTIAVIAGGCARPEAQTPTPPAAQLDQRAAAKPACCSTGGTEVPNGKPYDSTFFEHSGTNPFIDTADDHLSTFGMDVDTASFAIMRRFLADGEPARSCFGACRGVHQRVRLPLRTA
jgi:hypothetical protein